MAFEREHAATLRQRLSEPPTRLIVVAGPRQIGKSTLVRQVFAGLTPTRWTSRFVAADDSVDWPGARGRAESPRAFTTAIPGSAPTADWLVQHWMRARTTARSLPPGQTCVLAIDEVQKIPRWSDVVKGLWDADRAASMPLHIVLLGSSPWLMQRGLSESLAGRFEMIRMNHWSYGEMQSAFDFSLDEYLYFGGYPGAASYIRDERRWGEYVRDALVGPTVEADILQMNRIDKPALLKAMFELGCTYSGQILSYRKLQGQLQDAGNTVTLAHYLNLLSHAGLLTGLSQFTVHKHRQRASSPKLNALNTALMSVLTGYTFAAAKLDRSYWGRLTESAVGAHLVNTAAGGCEVHYWRERDNEVDFVLSRGDRQVAIEVKSGSKRSRLQGMDAFVAHFKTARQVVVGDGGVLLAEFLAHPAEHWLE